MKNNSKREKRIWSLFSFRKPIKNFFQAPLDYVTHQKLPEQLPEVVEQFEKKMNSFFSDIL